MYILFLVLLIIIFAVLTRASVLMKNKHQNTVATEKMRCKRYCIIMTLLWSATAAVFVMSFFGGISLTDLGFRPISFNYSIWFTLPTFVLSGLALAVFTHKLISSLVSKKYQQKMEDQLAGVEGVADLLPRTKKEKGMWAFVSLSAGICEEIIYRGFLVFLLQAIFPEIPIFLIILIPSALFGLSHFYQGLQGIIGTGVLGALFLSLFLASGSLLLPIILHFIIDFSSTFSLSEKVK